MGITIHQKIVLDAMQRLTPSEQRKIVQYVASMGKPRLPKTAKKHKDTAQNAASGSKKEKKLQRTLKRYHSNPANVSKTVTSPVKNVDSIPVKVQPPSGPQHGRVSISPLKSAPLLHSAK